MASKICLELLELLQHVGEVLGIEAGASSHVSKMLKLGLGSL